MKADCSHCTPAEAGAQQRNRARAKLPWLAFLTSALAMLVPKCPMCLVAYLSAFGVTFGMASFTLSALRPLAVLFTALALGFAFRRVKQ
jgi:hypothetical protein